MAEYKKHSTNPYRLVKTEMVESEYDLPNLIGQRDSLMAEVERLDKIIVEAEKVGVNKSGQLEELK